MNKKRVITIVIDSMGIGALPDCEDFNDEKTCNTICNTAHLVGGLKIPNLEKLGIGNLADIEGVKKVENPLGTSLILKMKSLGKDTTTGHWELMGLPLKNPFKTYLKFPDELIEKFIKETKCGGILGNCPASGTKIIEELGPEHAKTKFPIIYTSADSVYQIAVDIDIIPLETLYEWCKIARRLLDEGNYGISRVIARPYQIIEGKPQRIGKYRHDYSVPPPSDTVLDEIEKQGGSVLGIGKINDIFVTKGITETIPTGCNKEGLIATLDAIKSKKHSMIFTNLVDTDMVYGHRRNAKGYGEAIEEVDSYLGEMIKNLKDDDLLIITADHGCDPTAKGTDHTREQVPFIMYSKTKEPIKNLPVQESFVYCADEIRAWLEL